VNDKNYIQEPSGSITTKAEDKIVTDGRTTVKPVSNQQIMGSYDHEIRLFYDSTAKARATQLKFATIND
jgi:hypothetical protein